MTNTESTAVAESAAPAEKAPIVDMAAHDYPILLNMFWEAMQKDEVAGSKLRDVMQALAAYPFADNEPKFSYQEQMKLYHIGQKLFDVRFIMMKEVVESNKKELEAFFDKPPEATGMEDRIGEIV